MEYSCFVTCRGLNFIPCCVVQSDSGVEPVNIDKLKVASRTKARSVRQYLNGSTFTNFQHVHTALQILILSVFSKFQKTYMPYNHVIY